MVDIDTTTNDGALDVRSLKFVLNEDARYLAVAHIDIVGPLHRDLLVTIGFADAFADAEGNGLRKHEEFSGWKSRGVEEKAEE